MYSGQTPVEWVSPPPWCIAPPVQCIVVVNDVLRALATKSLHGQVIS